MSNALIRSAWFETRCDASLLTMTTLFAIPILRHAEERSLERVSKHPQPMSRP